MMKNFLKTLLKQPLTNARKTLRNALKPINSNADLPFLTKRAEELSYLDFVELTKKIENHIKI